MAGKIVRQVTEQSDASLSRLFIIRPVATTLLMLAILLVGGLAFRLLPISALPQVDYPTIQVVTLYPGAGPDEMATLVTAPLERQLGQMPGLARLSSSSSGGASVITLQFNLNLTLDIAEQEVQAAINAASNLLPTDLPSPPIYNKVNPADAPILTLAVLSTTLPLPKVEDAVETRLAQKLSQISGVGLISINGGQRPAVRIRANPQALAAMGLSLQDVQTAVATSNVNQAKGSFDGAARASTITANDQLKSAQDYKNLIIAYKKGVPVRLADVADIADDAENVRLAAWANKSPAVILNIQRQPGANVIAVVDNIKALLPQLQSGLPGSVDVIILADRTTTIRASVSDVEFELMLSVILVVLVIFAFLGTWRATLIPAVAVPLSLIGTFGLMYVAGFSINNLTLMALTIATGFVVDDAVVMIENIARHIEAGDPPMDAALKGAKQIGFTIISLTVSLIAVLIPLLFMSDIVGRLFREFAITLAVAILISAFVSLTLTPMMCARLLKSKQETSNSRFANAAGCIIDKIIVKYSKMLNWVLDSQALILILSLATFVLTVALYLVVPKGFFPVQDTGVILGISEAPQSVSFADMATRQQKLAALVLADSAVESLSSSIGVDGTNQTLNVGRMLITLKPLATRGLSATEVIDRLQPSLVSLPGTKLYLQPVQDLTIADAVSRTPYQLSLTDPNPDELAIWTHKLIDRLQSMPELTDVTSDLQNQGQQAYVDIDRETAGRLGVTVAAIDNALYSAFGQRLISTIYTQTTQYRVVLEISKFDKEHGLSALNTLYVPGANGTQVPLSALAHVVKRQGNLSVNHVAQFPATTVSFNLTKGASLGAATKVVQAAETEIAMPASVQSEFQGAALAFKASLGNTLWLILAALVTVYLVLGVLYESFIHPLTILSTLPSAAIGAFLALLLSGQELGIIGIIGIILLIGIVKKNAIMMIDFALDAERHHGKSPRDAIYEACLLRFRPILMTTLAALLAALPLMFGNGVGSELRHPLGLTLVGGLLVSQVLTLFTTPVIYLAFDTLSARMQRRHLPQ